jgi:hypothetical protein
MMSFPSREEDRRMKKLLFGFLAVAVLLAGSVVSSYADGRHGGGGRGGGWHGGGGHGGRWHGGWHGGWRAPVVFVGPRFFVGSSFYYPGAYYPRAYYPGAYAYAPPVVVAAPAPPVYTQSPQYWYYCQNPSGYYPSVPQCPTQWLQVAPQQQ